jgi:hypothetical protein
MVVAADAVLPSRWAKTSGVSKQRAGQDFPLLLNYLTAVLSSAWRVCRCPIWRGLWPSACFSPLQPQGLDMTSVSISNTGSAAATASAPPQGAASLAAPAQAAGNQLPVFMQLLQNSLQTVPFVQTQPTGNVQVARQTNSSSPMPSQQAARPSSSTDTDPTNISGSLALALLGFLQQPVNTCVEPARAAANLGTHETGSTLPAGSHVPSTTQLTSPFSSAQALANVPTPTPAQDPEPVPSQAGAQVPAQALTQALTQASVQAEAQVVPTSIVVPSAAAPEKAAVGARASAPAPSAPQSTSSAVASDSTLVSMASQGDATESQTAQVRSETNGAATTNTILEQITALKGALSVAALVIVKTNSSSATAQPQEHAALESASLPKDAAAANLPNFAPQEQPPADQRAPFAGRGNTWHANVPSVGPAANAQSQSNSHFSDSHEDANSRSPLGSANAPAQAPASEIPTFAQASSAALATKPDSVVPSTGSAPVIHTATKEQLPEGANPLSSTNSAELPGGLQAWNGGENAQTRLVQSAHLAGRLDQSEMHIAMQTDKLGAVELRARVNGDQVGAAISVERHEAHAVLASELPALHQGLADRQLRIENITLFQGSFGSAAAGDGGAASQQRDAAAQHSTKSPWATSDSSGIPQVIPGVWTSESRMIFDSNGRLSVRA